VGTDVVEVASCDLAFVGRYSKVEGDDEVTYTPCSSRTLCDDIDPDEIIVE